METSPHPRSGAGKSLRLQLAEVVDRVDLIELVLFALSVNTPHLHLDLTFEVENGFADLTNHVVLGNALTAVTANNVHTATGKLGFDGSELFWANGLFQFDEHSLSSQGKGVMKWLNVREKNRHHG